MRRLGHLRSPLFLVTRWCLLSVVAIVPMNQGLAATPGEFNFQRRLLDSGGEAVIGLVALALELFDAASAGTSLWSESQRDVPVLDGVYNVALGSITPIGAAVLAGPRSKLAGAPA